MKLRKKIKHLSLSLTSGCFIVVLAVSSAFSQGLEIPTDEASIAKGKATFQGNCRTCHKIHENYTGPALAGVYDRTPSIEWIVSFVQNSSKVIASGDPYANQIYEEWNKVQMQIFPTWTEDDILPILAYIQDETIKGPVVVGPDSTQVTATGGGSGVPSEYLNLIIVGLVVVLALILLVLFFIMSVLRRFAAEKKDLDEADEEQINQGFSFERTFKSKPFIWLATFLFTAVVFKALIAGAFNVGVQKGYAPTQPIAFSHKIHAGQYEIDCQYCHTGVNKSKSANIPSANICMNCHTQIKTESPQIQKIYAAIENNKPIEWIRVHNLPDLAYFNHSQHVKVGGIECQTCHGPIEEMEVVKQHSLLTMGWCIDCHRKTNVNTKGNEYYDKLVEIHDGRGKEPLKVEDIGGLECAKCHY
ncbi:MAG: cytochrome c3 family protein [Bacteroidota bacterium]